MYRCSATLISFIGAECQAATEVGVRQLPKVGKAGTECDLSPGYRTRTKQFGAGDGTRTRYLNLGKVALCQVSYSRSSGRCGQRVYLEHSLTSVRGVGAQALQEPDDEIAHLLAGGRGILGVGHVEARLGDGARQEQSQGPQGLRLDHATTHGLA